MPAASLRLSAVAAVLALTATTSGCRPDTVRLTAVVRAGDEAAFDLRVRTRSATTIAGEGTRRADDTVALLLEQRVLGIASDGTAAVAVAVRPAGPADDRRPTVRYRATLDVSGALIAVDDPTVGAAAGDGPTLPDTFQIGGPPDRPLRPGDRWRIERDVSIAGRRVKVRGSGRLVSLGVVGGRNVATIETVTSVPVRRTVKSEGGDLRLHGTQRTTARTTRRITGGSVESSNASTTADLSLRLLGTGTGTEVPGRLRLDVDSEVRRR